MAKAASQAVVSERGPIQSIDAGGRIKSLAVHDDRLFWQVLQAPGATIACMPVGGDKPTTIATGQRQFQHWTFVGDWMYFAEAESKLQRRPIAGGKIEQVSGTKVDVLVSHGDWLAWANPKTVYAQASKAKKPAAVASGPDVSGLALDDRDVFFFEELRDRDCRLLRADRRGCSPAITVATGQVFAHRLHRNGDWLYWAVSREADRGIPFALRRVSRGGGPVDELCKADRVHDLTVHGDHVYWISYVSRCALWRVPVIGGNPEELVSAPEHSIEAFAVTPKRLYFAMYPNLCWIPLDAAPTSKPKAKATPAQSRPRKTARR